MTTGHIQFSTDILRRLGEELNPSPDQGILELVKNSYDADATSCVVEFDRLDWPNGSVSVSDDGDGMNAQAIADGWLVVGSSLKSPTRRTRLGRIPAGSKGLGRLAALRLGRCATLITRPRSEPEYQYELELNWDAYDNVRVVENVPVPVRRLKRRPGVAHGTQVILKQLQPRIGRLDAKRLARVLILLADPFTDDPSAFKPTLKSTEFADLEQLVAARYFSDADLHLVARLSQAGRAEVSVVDWKGATIFDGRHNDVANRRSGARYECPLAELDLWVFILTRDAFQARNTTLSEVRAWLKQFGGVHLYYHGLRVGPYGNPGNDWLEINLRRAQSPEERPSTNTSIGRLSVVDPRSMLLQKTDRTGFVEGPAFAELRAFAQDSLEWMARRRLEAAEDRRRRERRETPKRSTRAKVTVEKALQDLPPRSRTQVETAFSSYDRSREREVNALRREVQLYRTLSTAGITAATFAHEAVGNPIKAITNSISTIGRRGQVAFGKKYADVLEKPVDSIVRSIGALAVLGNATLRLLQSEKRRVARVDVNQVIRNTLETLEPFLASRQIKVTRQLCEGEPYLKGTEASVESIVTNLLNNSIVALEQTRRFREIGLVTVVDGGFVLIQIEDNGPGIQEIELKDIWLPGETTRANGTGLGLTIVRDATNDLGGHVNAKSPGHLGGASFTVALPILGS